MNKPHLKRRLGVCVLAAALLVIVPSAFAGHVHTTGEWYHGLGDGANFNFYVHAFNENTTGVYCNTLVVYFAGYSTWDDWYNGTQCTTHHHASIDTYPYNECYFRSWHRSIQSDPHNLPAHGHLHHYYCGT